MARFEHSRERKSEKGSRHGPPKRYGRHRGEGRGDFEDRPRGKGRRSFGDRDSKRNSRNRRDFEMTKVICDSCGDECEVPFKPSSNKPVYCRDCFTKKGKGSSAKPSNRDLDVINEKLNKIMKALKIK